MPATYFHFGPKKTEGSRAQTTEWEKSGAFQLCKATGDPRPVRVHDHEPGMHLDCVNHFRNKEDRSCMRHFDLTTTTLAQGNAKFIFGVRLGLSRKAVRSSCAWARRRGRLQTALATTVDRHAINHHNEPRRRFRSVATRPVGAE